jgi:hypothetical protein
MRKYLVFNLFSNSNFLFKGVFSLTMDLYELERLRAANGPQLKYNRNKEGKGDCHKHEVIFVQKCVLQLEGYTTALEMDKDGERD